MMSSAAGIHPDMRWLAIPLTAIVFTLLVLLPLESAGQWSANPGETVRNAFGPSKNQGAPMLSLIHI